MPTHVAKPTVVEAAGNVPKTICEYIGRVNTGTNHVSVAHMSSPSGWEEPGQRPEFDECTVVLRGALHVRTETGSTIEVNAGEAVIAHKSEWVQYSTPGPEGADYIAVCVPAFSPETVHRDSE
jgi:mannose-6-phosphate isomerase-like protein (cupin superfamily)